MLLQKLRYGALALHTAPSSCNFFLLLSLSPPTFHTASLKASSMLFSLGGGGGMCRAAFLSFCKNQKEKRIEVATRNQSQQNSTQRVTLKHRTACNAQHENCNTHRTRVVYGDRGVWWQRSGKARASALTLTTKRTAGGAKRQKQP